MGSHDRRFLPLPLLALALLAAADAALPDQAQPLLAGYGKDFRPFVNYNGIPIAPRPSPWIRAAEIQRADANMVGGEGPRPSFPEQQPPPAFLQRGVPQFPLLSADGPIFQRAAPLMPASYGSGNVAGQGPQAYEHSMLLIDHPPEQMVPQQQQPDQQTAFRNGDQQPQAEEQPMVMIEPQPAPQGQPDHQPIARSDGSAAVQFEYQPAAEAPQPQPQPQPADSGDVMTAGSPPEENMEGQAPPADLQTSAQESGVAAGQVPQQDSSAPVFMPYQQGPRPLGVVFQSNEPYPGLSPPPAYQMEQVGWGVPPMQVPVYPNPYRDQPPRQQQQPFAYYPDGYQPFPSQRQAFGARPFVEDRSDTVPRPPGGVAPFLMPSSYLPETPLEETKQDEVIPDKAEDSESHPDEKSKDDSSEEDDDASDEIENKVKALKDAADVEEEVVPALVVFLRKKGHKAFHDKDSVGIPGKEARFRRSPGIGGGSGSSSHSSSSSSSSSGPVYFGNGGSGSYSSSQSSASSSSGAGAPLGIGGGGPGLGGSNSFYGGGHAPSSGFGVSGGGGGGGNNGYGNTGYGNAGYGSAGHGGGGYGNTGYGSSVGGGGGGGYGGGGYGGGVGPSGGGGSYGGGCSTCGDDNVLLNRFGEVDGSSGPFTVGGSGASKGQGVHSSASSSIDSTGKVTYSVSAGKH